MTEIKTKEVSLKINNIPTTLYMRTPTQEDLKSIINIEQLCFPPAEAATPEALTDRLKIFPENFLVAEILNEKKEKEMIGFVDGLLYAKPELIDEIYADAKLNDPKGKYLIVMGLNTIPKYRRNGIASELMKFLIEISKERGHEGMVLTCKDIYIKLYEKVGFKNCGVSDSTHGGVVWYDMKLFYNQ